MDLQKNRGSGFFLLNVLIHCPAMPIYSLEHMKLLSVAALLRGLHLVCSYAEAGYWEW
jgi:hypothetical protein